MRRTLVLSLRKTQGTSPRAVIEPSLSRDHVKMPNISATKIPGDVEKGTGRQTAMEDMCCCQAICLHQAGD